MKVMFPYQLAARTIWGEARGEGSDGIRAVAHVIVNRRAAGHWGASLATVCLWPYQFSALNYHDPNWRRLLELADDDPMLLQCYGAIVGADTLTDDDPTAGATFYYAKSIPAPNWTAGMEQTAVIGNQVFFRAGVATSRLAMAAMHVEGVYRAAGMAVLTETPVVINFKPEAA